PDSKMLATVSDDQDLRLWEISTGKELRRLPGNRESVKVLRFGPNGKTLVAAYEKGELWAWETATGKQTHHIKDEIVRRRAALPPDCSIGITLTNENTKTFTIVRHPLAPKQARGLLVELDGPGAMAEHAVFSADGKLVAVPSSYRVGIWNVSTGKN